MTPAPLAAAPRAVPPPVEGLRIFLSAGEPSGDRHAGGVVAALLGGGSRTEVVAIGGPAVSGAGARMLGASDSLGTMGFAEVVAGAPTHLRYLRETRAALRSGDFDLAVLVDYPGFHMRVAAQAKAAGVPVLWYIAPQMWAWGAHRAPRFRRRVDRLAAILPFEVEFFRARGIPTEFVGHPLLDAAPAPDRWVARRALGIPESHRVLTLAPGSRPGEIRRHWPTFREAARRVIARLGGEWTVVVAGVADAQYDGAGGWVVPRGDSGTAFAAADAAICKSGTSTLEAALAGTPHVIGYRAHPASYAIAKRVVRCASIGLPNLILGEDVVPELVQGAMTPDGLAGATTVLVRSRDAAGAQRAGFDRMRRRLGTAGAATRVAALAREMVECPAGA